MATQTTIEISDYVPTVFDFSPSRLTDEQFESLCRNHPDLNLEMSSEGELIIVPPTSPESGWKNSRLTRRIDEWAETDATGIVFDSSTMFTLPNGAKRSPDVSWMTLEKWENLSRKERRKFARVVPDFVVELRSPSDALEDLQAKMLEYVASSARLGWLIDPENKTVHIYRADGSIEILNDPEKLSGEDVLKGFELNVREIW